MQVKSVREAVVAGKRVLLRLDLNVPLQNGKVADDTRIKATLPTIRFLLERGAKIVVLTHLGRPGGVVVEALKVAPVAARLAELVGQEVEVLENLRFNPGEEANDTTFAKELAQKGDLYVGDAFADAHRAHASIVGLPKLLPSYAGFLMEREVAELTGALTPPSGSVAVVAVTKADKIPLIQKLATLYRTVFVGGPVPSDFVPSAPNIQIPVDGIPELKGLLDIGPKTREAWVTEVGAAPFVLWNGPVGWYEKGYQEGTNAIAETIISNGVRAVIGGGDTLSALKGFEFNPAKVFLSTGGGAMLDFLSEGTLPGLEVLKK